MSCVLAQGALKSYMIAPLVNTVQTGAVHRDLIVDLVGLVGDTINVLVLDVDLETSVS